MRLAELVNLKETDLDFHHDTIKVLGKRNKERLIPFSKKFESLMKLYLKKKGIRLGKSMILFSLTRATNLFQDGLSHCYQAFGEPSPP